MPCSHDDVASKIMDAVEHEHGYNVTRSSFLMLRRMNRNEKENGNIVSFQPDDFLFAVRFISEAEISESFIIEHR